MDTIKYNQKKTKMIEEFYVKTPLHTTACFVLLENKYDINCGEFSAEPGCPRATTGGPTAEMLNWLEE